MIKNFHDYVIFQFQFITGNVKEIDHIPDFPDNIGIHDCQKIKDDNVNGIIITNPAFANLILFKIHIETDSLLGWQQKKIYDFIQWLSDNYERKIISVQFYKETDINPEKCFVYFMIEFDS